VRSGQVSSIQGQVRSGQVKLGMVGSVQGHIIVSTRSDQVRTMSRHIRSTSRQVRLSQVRSYSG